MDYIQDIAAERLKKVIDGEQGGISKFVNWQGTVGQKYYIVYLLMLFVDKNHKEFEVLMNTKYLFEKYEKYSIWEWSIKNVFWMKEMKIKCNIKQFLT